MARRFFMNMRDRNRFVRDEEGDELKEGHSLREHAIATARDMILHTRMDMVRDWLDWGFEVTDETGELVLVLPFEEAAEGMHGGRAGM
ncbi:MAG TPA: hypothetical protein VGN97_19985 [Mesorhizobium sp.]|jgi:hypothetical protein|nr:hypothetical protein [Mesorhizobium sp.]